jgi:hypothetical protein
MRAPHVADADAESPYRPWAGAELGERLVTPVRAITVDGERIEPVRARFAPAHPWVRQRPECFRPCASADKATAAHMRELYRRAEARLMTREKPNAGGEGRR